MFPTELRITKQKEFSRVFKSGKTLKTALFRISTAKNKHGHTRIGVVVANKSVKGAVRGNRVKRQTRAILKELYPGIREGYDIVLSALPAAAEADYDTMRQEITAGLSRIGFYSAPAPQQ